MYSSFLLSSSSSASLSKISWFVLWKSFSDQKFWITVNQKWTRIQNHTYRNIIISTDLDVNKCNDSTCLFYTLDNLLQFLLDIFRDFNERRQDIAWRRIFVRRINLDFVDHYSRWNIIERRQETAEENIFVKLILRVCYWWWFTIISLVFINRCRMLCRQEIFLLRDCFVINNIDQIVLTSIHNFTRNSIIFEKSLNFNAKNAYNSAI